MRGENPIGTDGTRFLALDLTRETPSIFPRCAKIPRHVRLGPNANYFERRRVAFHRDFIARVKVQ